MKQFFSGLLFFLIINSCEEIIEVEDISQETVTILAPIDNSIIGQSSVTFSWQNLEFAEQYQLQIAIPDFNNAIQVVEDTVVSSNNFNKLLNQGNYEWRLRALNSAYQTQFQTQVFTIEE